MKHRSSNANAASSTHLSKPQSPRQSNQNETLHRTSPRTSKIVQRKRSRRRLSSVQMVGTAVLVSASVYLSVSSWRMHRSNTNESREDGRAIESQPTRPPALRRTTPKSEISAVLPPTPPLLNHTHAIPNILIFTHHTNLLDDAAVKRLLHTIATDNNATLAGAARQDTIEVHALADNVRNIIRLHPDATVRFLTDQDCVASIQAAMGTDTELVNFFLHEKQGMYKADLCRGAALWETGGIYLDVDLGVRLRLWDVLLEDTEFATVRVHLQSQHPGAFFQAFMAVTPQHAIVARYLELFLDYYQGRLPAHAVNGPLGVMLLRRAFDEVTTTADAVDPTTQRNTTAAAAAVDDDTVEIWQELLYLPQFQKTILSHVPPPVWGKRRACKFVVVANLQEPFLVPFYSRIANSRMCPAQPRGDMGNYAKATDTVEEHGDGKAADETADA